MSERFIKLIMSKEFDYLLRNHPNALLLLILIASRARRYDGEPDGLIIGDALIGDCEACGLSRQEYRTALIILERRSHIRIIETARTRKKSTNGATTYGTKVRILRSDVCDINPDYTNQRINHRPTTDQPPTNHEQERNKKEQEDVSVCMSVKENQNQEGEKETLSELIVMKSRITQCGVTTANRIEVIEFLKKHIEHFTDDEIEDSIKTMIQQDTWLNGTIKNYLIGIILKKREKIKNEQYASARKPTKYQSKQDPVQRSADTFTKSSIRWEPQI